MVRRITTLLALLLFLSGAGAARADEPSKAAKKEASERFKKGVTLYDAGDLQAAQVEFERAYQLAPSYKVLYNIANIQRDLKDYVKALDTYERYLADGGKDIDKKRRREVEAQVELLRGLVAYVEIVTNVDGVEITLDEEIVGTSPLAAGPMRINPGRKKIAGRKDGRLPAQKSVAIASGETVRVELELAPEPPPRVVMAPAAAPLPPPARPSRMTNGAWIGLGVTGALAIGATAAGFMALSASDDLAAMRFAGEDDSALTDQQRKVKLLALTSDVLTIGAAATLGVTLYLVITHHPKNEADARERDRGVRVGVGPGGVFAWGTF